MPALLAMLLPALLPTFADGLRGIFNWATKGAGAEPANIEEAIKLMGAETERLRVVASLDQPSTNISLWVADLRASFRYIAAGLIILGGLGLVAAVVVLDPNERLVVFTDSYLQGLVAPVFSFMFGQRMHMSLKNGLK